MIVHSQIIRGGLEEAGRKRKSHKKSRKGCRNCKLRRVKCDEASPECRKCINFGVTCNYDSRIPDLQMCAGRNAAPTLMNRKSGKEPFMVNPEILGDGLHQFPAVQSAPYPVLDPYSSFRLDKQSLGLLDRFRSRTILTLGTSKTAPVYQMVSVREALAHPYLMHIVLTLTSIHDRYLDPASNGKPTVTELHHWSQGASLLNKKLSKPLPPDDRDSLWTAASLLGAIAFASVDASQPEEAWPLKNSDASDLQWLRMSEGKMIIWELANPLRPESAFYKLALELMKDNLFSDRSSFALEDVPEAFYSLYGLDKSSNNENNAYYSAIRTLSALIHMECNHTTIAKYLSFMSHMGKEFKGLVGQKEPRALLLLAFWFGRVSHGTWWVSQRASLEGRSVCMYLEKFHSDETAIMALLELPKRDLGLMV